jgi:hypothetical protein
MPLCNARPRPWLRAAHEAHHIRVIESLEFTIGWPVEELRTLERFRKRRHLAFYERAYLTSEAEVDEIVALAERLHLDVETWLAKEHPEFLES